MSNSSVIRRFGSHRFGLSRNVPEKFSGALDLDTIQLLARAFDLALEQYRNMAPTSRNEAFIHAELARCIVATARTGERDEDALAKRGYLMFQALRYESPQSASSPVKEIDEYRGSTA